MEWRVLGGGAPDAKVPLHTGQCLSGPRKARQERGPKEPCGWNRKGDNMNVLAMSIVPFLFFMISLGAVIYVLTLITRLTRAAERIAASMERNPPGHDGVSVATAS
jgi:hypothetical protein